MKLFGVNTEGKIFFVNENDIEKYGSAEEAVKVIHFPPEIVKPTPKAKKDEPAIEPNVE